MGGVPQSSLAGWRLESAWLATMHVTSVPADLVAYAFAMVHIPCLGGGSDKGLARRAPCMQQWGECARVGCVCVCVATTVGTSGAVRTVRVRRHLAGLPRDPTWQVCRTRCTASLVACAFAMVRIPRLGGGSDKGRYASPAQGVRKGPAVDLGVRIGADLGCPDETRSCPCPLSAPRGRSRLRVLCPSRGLRAHRALWVKPAPDRATVLCHTPPPISRRIILIK